MRPHFADSLRTWRSALTIHGLARTRALPYLISILAAALLLAGPVPQQARAGLIVGTVASEFAVLSQFDNSQTNFNNGTINGDIGIGSPRQFTISDAQVNGAVRFSGAANTSGVTATNVTGGVIANDSVVTQALNYVNNLSQTLGGEAGTNLVAPLTSSRTINASSGVLDGMGDRVFQTSSVNLNNGTTLTINGSATDTVVINVTDNNPAFNGTILLTGGITADQVVFNMYGGNYTTHSGGPTLTISTNGNTSTGVFLDPNGSMQMNHSVLNGRFFGGDLSNQQIVSGANINAPPASVPEPSTMAAALSGAMALGLAGLSRIRRRKKIASV
jgi:hypothetical protein